MSADGTMTAVDIRCFFPFLGLGIGALGFQRGNARVGNLKARFQVLGGIDSDAGAVANASRLLGVQCTVQDLFSLEQYRAFHGREPPDGWREATPADIRRAAGNERPQIVFTSPPCKGFSGLLAEGMSKSARYQALNELTLRGIWLCLEAWSDDPPEFFLLENVPRIASRGRKLLDQIGALLRHYGYAVAETTHDCGVIGGLAQSRKRFLLVARHMEKVPSYLYQPPSRPLRAVGDVLGRLPLPGTVDIALHRLPALQWKTWVRLAFVEAGKDWRSLNRLAVEAGVLRDYGIVPEWAMRNGVLGVGRWEDPAGLVAGRAGPTNGAFAVADPRRLDGQAEFGQYGVKRWGDVGQTVIGKAAVGAGNFAVADPRYKRDERTPFNNVYRVVRFDQPAPAVTAGGAPTAGGLAVADPRPGWDGRYGNLHVAEWDETSRTVIGGGKGVQGGWLSVADPRPRLDPAKRESYLTCGHYGVVPWSDPAGAVTGSLKTDSGPGNVADPRLPGAGEKVSCLIVAEDGTWHRPFSTLELACLQTILDPEEWATFELRSKSDSEQREWIGNAVPRDAAAAMAGEFGRAILAAMSGETFILTSSPVWVRPVIAAIQCGSGG